MKYYLYIEKSLVKHAFPPKIPPKCVYMDILSVLHRNREHAFFRLSGQAKTPAILKGVKAPPSLIDFCIRSICNNIGRYRYFFVRKMHV